MAALIPRLLAITPPAPGPWLRGLGALRDAGVDGLIVRLVGAPAALPAVLDQLPPGLVVLVRPVAPGDADAALARGLGLHLPSAAPPAAWRSRQPGLLSAACHSAAELSRAADAGCDLALLSPVFPPGSKPNDTRPVLGLSGFAALCGPCPIPVLALGGVTADRVPALCAAGAAGVAGISAFFSHDRTRPAHAARLRAAL